MPPTPILLTSLKLVGRGYDRSPPLTSSLKTTGTRANRNPGFLVNPGRCLGFAPLRSQGPVQQGSSTVCGPTKDGTQRDAWVTVPHSPMDHSDMDYCPFTAFGSQSWSLELQQGQVGKKKTNSDCIKNLNFHAPKSSDNQNCK